MIRGMIVYVLVRLLALAAIIALAFMLFGCNARDAAPEPQAPPVKAPVVLDDGTKPAPEKEKDKNKVTKAVPPSFDNKVLYNKVLDELVEHHPLAFDPDKRQAWQRRWTLSNTAFSLFPGEDATVKEINKMASSLGGFVFLSKRKDEHQKTSFWDASGIKRCLGFSPRFKHQAKLMAGLPANPSIEEITKRQRVSKDNPLSFGIMNGDCKMSQQVFSNDSIISVNGRSIDGMLLEEVMDLLYGDGTKPATMVLERDNFKGGFTTLTVTATPTHYLRTPMEHRVLPGDIHYVRLSHVFDTRPMTSMLAKMLEDAGKGKGIIFDLRSCKGDYGDAHWPLIEFFLQQGTLFTQVYRRGDKIQHNELMVTKNQLLSTHPAGSGSSTTPDFSYQERFQRPVVPANVPVVVLINGEVSVTAELVAGSLQGNKRAVLVGTETTVCGRDMSRMWPREMPFGYYLYMQDLLQLPAGRDPAKCGFRFDPVVPDVVVQQPADGTDAQLEAAKTKMRELIAKP